MSFFLNYFAILVFLAIGAGLSTIMVIMPFITSKRNPYHSKTTTYECGFEPSGDNRARFDIKFYLVAILFIIFDIEIAFLFPFVTSLSETGKFGFWSVMTFLGILGVGFGYEWRKGALEWK